MMNTDEMELRIELAAIQLEALKSQLALLEQKLELAKTMYGTPQGS
jgi:hypothetical protein